MDVQPRDVEDQQRGERLLAGGEKLAQQRVVVLAIKPD